jgi:excisionase family DNA binding protein
MEVMSVDEAASILDVHSSRVRQLLVGGGLRGQRVGGRWLVDRDSVLDRKEQGPHVGRPLSPRNAWGALALLGGYSPGWLSAAEKSRMHARLRDLAARRQMSGVHLQRLLAARADVRRYRIHAGLLLALVSGREVVMGGASAAAAVGADYVAPNRVEVYVHPDSVEILVAEFGIAPDSRRGNLVLRVPPMEAWSYLTSSPSPQERGQYAPAPVVAADLLDIREDRAQAAASQLLASLLAGFVHGPEKR